MPDAASIKAAVAGLGVERPDESCDGMTVRKARTAPVR
jgi:hypothetical protein